MLTLDDDKSYGRASRNKGRNQESRKKDRAVGKQGDSDWAALER